MLEPPSPRPDAPSPDAYFAAVPSLAELINLAAAPMDMRHINAGDGARHCDRWYQRCTDAWVCGAADADAVSLGDWGALAMRCHACPKHCALGLKTSTLPMQGLRERAAWRRRVAIQQRHLVVMQILMTHWPMLGQTIVPSTPSLSGNMHVVDRLRGRRAVSQIHAWVKHHTPVSNLKCLGGLGMNPRSPKSAPTPLPFGPRRVLV